MNTLLQLVTSEGNSVPPYIAEVSAIDGQCFCQQYAPGGRPVRILVDGQEAYGIVYEELPAHSWQVETISGAIYRFLEMTNQQMDGEFLRSPWCCPYCHMALTPEGALQLFTNAQIETYRCVNPRCSVLLDDSRTNVLFAPNDDNTVSVMGGRQLSQIELAERCISEVP